MRFLVTAALSLTALTPSLSAQMMGSTMDAEWVYPSFGSVLEGHTVVVTAGVELLSGTIINDSKFEIDLGDDWVEFRFNATSNWSSSSFNGWLFRDALSTLPPISNYSIDSFSAGIGNTGGIVTGFNDNECWANFGGMTVAGAGDWIRMKVDFGGLDLSASSLFGGGNGTLTVTGATVGGGVLIGYSLTGAGPTNTAFGPVDMSPPITQLPVLTADTAGVATITTGIPARASGFTVYMQAADLTTSTLTNSLAEVIL